jgi:hypothetical protein
MDRAFGDIRSMALDDHEKRLDFFLSQRPKRLGV